MHELDKAAFERVRPLANAAALACAASAVIDGNSPGRVWVDDPAAPRAALLDTPEGHYVLGKPGAGETAAGLRDLILTTLSPGGRGERWWWFYLRCGSEAWAPVIQAALPADRIAEEPREFYLCHASTVDGRALLPAGFELRRVDHALLQQDGLKNIERIRRPARSNFGSLDAFLEKGFAFCALHEDRIVSWCVCDCVCGNRCEVGIHTAEDYRRRGLGAATVAAALSWAFQQGFRSVGWHCHAFNLASAATALKAGFQRVGGYTAFKICARPTDATVLNATAALIQHRYQEAADLYSRALQAFQAAPVLASHLLSSQEERARVALMAACASALSGRPQAATALLDDAIDLAGYRQGGY